MLETIADPPEEELGTVGLVEWVVVGTVGFAVEVELGIALEMYLIGLVAEEGLGTGLDV